MKVFVRLFFTPEAILNVKNMKPLTRISELAHGSYNERLPVMVSMLPILAYCTFNVGYILS